MLNDVAIRNFLITVAGLVMMGVAIAVLAKSSKAQFSEVAKTGVNTLIGLIILAAGAGALLLVAFGQSILETIFPSDSVSDAPSGAGLDVLSVDMVIALQDVLSVLAWA